jgi:hypothetical protein
MSDISTLKEKINIRTFSLLLLGLVTGGLYMHIWMYKTYTALEEVTRIKTMSSAFFAFYLTIIGTIGHLSLVPHFYALYLIGFLFLLLAVVSMLWCFRVRRALRAYALAEHNFQLRMSLVFTGLFGFYYVNYCINALPRDKQKYERKKQLTENSVEI